MLDNRNALTRLKPVAGPCLLQTPKDVLKFCVEPIAFHVAMDFQMMMSTLSLILIRYNTLRFFVDTLDLYEVFRRFPRHLWNLLR